MNSKRLYQTERRHDMKLIYELCGFDTVSSALLMAIEIRSETGLEPERIVMDDGTSVALNLEDFKQLQKGELSDEEYIAKHRIIQ